MKRLLSIVMGAVCALSALGQDIIVTTDATRINARIVEVTETEIGYRQYPDEEGPIYHTPIDKVVTVLYENGQVFVFNNALSDPKLYANVIRQPILPGMITKTKDVYYLKEDTQVTRMSEQAYLKFIEDNCPEAWQSYLKGEHQYKIGWRFFGSGLVLATVGIPICCVGQKMMNKTQTDDHDYWYGYGMRAAGIIMVAGGVACEIVSIPLLAVGSHKQKKSFEVYNKCYIDQHTPVQNEGTSQVTLNLNASSNGVGLALKF